MTTTAPPRLEVRLRSKQALRDAMTFNRMNLRQLADACGRPSYRSTIGHLHSGARNTCSAHLGRRIEESLRLYPGALFDLRVSDVSADIGHTAPRGKRAA